ncbi:MAG: endonuclease MutS2, partial [Proteobacteria bacterium]|nr:endonuclease MutS2 [Pseudomonadota bacterium]
PLEKVRPENALIDAQDFLDIKTVLAVISDISSVDFEAAHCPQLKELTARLIGFPELLDRLGWTFDSEGKVVDDASVELYEIRKRLKSLNARIGNRLKEMVREENVAKFLQDDFITKRGERWVIPVRMDAKGEVAGVVHDVSSSGETAFMEPLEIIGLSNELGNLAADEKAEVIRILREICDEIRQDRDELLKQYKILIHLDLLNSIATYAEKLQMSPANINESSAVKLREAKHPLLISMEKSGTIKKVVPLSLTLEGEDRVMVITGPNAGGKTITMKTVGLLIVMAMSGIPIPAHPESTLPFTTNLLVDIGDEQSIESSLSTFSAHIARISKILEESSKGAVILLDEIGTGTEPAQGAAIACAILNELSNRGSLVLATTHLTDIIGFVYKTPGMMNASMAFDDTSHEPLYRLKEGEPGQSHAIETAIRFGLPREVTDFAGKLLGGMSAEFHELLKSLKEKGANYDALKAELEKERASLQEKSEKIKEKLKGAEDKKRSAYEEGLKEALTFLTNAKREARAILEETKKSPRMAIAKLEEKR